MTTTTTTRTKTSMTTKLTKFKTSKTLRTMKLPKSVKSKVVYKNLTTIYTTTALAVTLTYTATVKKKPCVR